MTRNYNKFLALFFFVTSASALSTNTVAQESCVTTGATLSQARSNYADQCTLDRVDCDPFNGIWYCASFQMNSPTPPALTGSTVAPAPVVVAPAPVVVAPAPVVVTPAPVVVAPTQPVSTPINPEPARPTCMSADSDSDGDGFGWENNTTCLITAESTLANSTVATTSSSTTTNNATPTAAARPDCNSADTDTDGDGFGWENNQTCLVTAVSIAATVAPSLPTTTATQNTTQSPTSTSTETSNNTSNANNTETAAPATIIAADITDLILVTGQSNALGAGTAYNASLDSPNSSVFAFTDKGWQVANLNQIWDLNWHPRNDPNTDPSNNFALHFGKTVAQQDSSRVVGFILATAPGARIDHWQTGGSFYAEIQAKVLDAINQLPHKSAIDGVLWHQGESDGQDRQYYTDALYTLISSLRSEPWSTSNAAFICGETKIASVNNRLNGLNRDSDPTTACVQGFDLPTLGDDRHFNATGLRLLGARYGDAYLNIVN